MTALLKTKSSTNYSVFDTGALKSWGENSVELAKTGKIPGKMFLKDVLGFTGCEISINSMPPGVGMPFFHKHDKNEEIYIFLSGKGQMQVDDDVVDVKEGTIIRVKNIADRAWRNNSNEPLVYLVLQVVQDSMSTSTIEDGLPSARPIAWPD